MTENLSITVPVCKIFLLQAPKETKVLHIVLEVYIEKIRTDIY